MVIKSGAVTFRLNSSQSELYSDAYLFLYFHNTTSFDSSLSFKLFLVRLQTGAKSEWNTQTQVEFAHVILAHWPTNKIRRFTCPSACGLPFSRYMCLSQNIFDIKWSWIWHMDPNKGMQPLVFVLIHNLSSPCIRASVYYELLFCAV